MKRLCIYLTYDKQNIIDGYIGYMLSELKTCVDYLVVVCNMTEIVRGREILEKYANAIFLRKNVGFDAGGFKDALCQYIGWEKVLSFDELILVNDSFFGPFRPMTGIFEEMDRKPVDFWGLAKHGKHIKESTCYPEHLQSFFLAVRDKMLHSESFRKYWEDMPYYKELGDVVRMHEFIFTSYFADQGFTFDCLADMEPNDSETAKNNYIQYAMLSYELIKKRNFPFLKKQPLAWNTLEYQTQENPRLALEYIDKQTNYDVNLIWNNIIRTLDISDLYRTFHLQYIVPSIEMKTARNYKVIIAVFVNYSGAKEYVEEYLERIKDICQIRIFSKRSDLLEAYKCDGYQCVRLDSTKECGSILKKLSESEMVCVLHDTDVTGDDEPSCIGKSYFFSIWDNLLKNDSQVGWIVERFEREQQLGLLAPPEANFGKYFGNMGDMWGENYEKVKNTVESMQFRCQMTYSKPPFIHPSNFWIRGSILNRLFERDLGDKDIIPYLWCYIAQDAGYYSGIVESENYAAMNEVNMQHYINVLANRLRRRCGDFHDFHELHKNISESTLKNFYNKIEHLYMYGTGIVAKEYQYMLPLIEAYIVSDGQPKKDTMNGKKILYLSEVEAKDDAGIIVCVGERNQRQVVPLLEQYGWHNYLCI